MTDRAETNEPEETDVVGTDAVAEPAKPADAEADADALDEPDAADAADDEPTERVERRSDVVIVTLVFVVLFGYDLLEAIEQLRLAPLIYEALGLGADIPWVLIYAAVAAPPVLFAGAMALSRGRRLVARAGIMLVALGVSAQLALLVEAWSASLLPY